MKINILKGDASFFERYCCSTLDVEVWWSSNIPFEKHFFWLAVTLRCNFFIECGGKVADWLARLV